MAKKIVKMEDGSQYEILNELGSGGQGVVYKVKDTKTGEVKALKIYHKPLSSRFLANLRRNIANKSPHPSFIWPEKLTVPLGAGKDRHGYTMSLYGSDFQSFIKLIKGKVNFSSKEAQIAAMIEMATAFGALHFAGYSYQDLNSGGVVFDYKRGRVLVCDNDNVAAYGDNLGIKGMFKYMAPEVAINMFIPDKHSDRFSLAVLMFMILCRAHPLDGKKRLEGQLGAQVKETIYGLNPIFIFHPTDTSNRPDPVIDANALIGWKAMPDFIKDLFIRAFTSGMPRVGRKRTEIDDDRQNRPSEKEWIAALYRWLETMVTCPHCKRAVTLDVDDNNVPRSRPCPHCSKNAGHPLPVLLIKKNGRLIRKIILEEGKIIYKDLFTKENTLDPGIQVVRSMKDPRFLGIKNLTTGKWFCTQEGAKGRVIEANLAVPVINGIYIEFDNEYTGEIVARSV